MLPGVWWILRVDCAQAMQSKAHARGEISHEDLIPFPATVERGRLSNGLCVVTVETPHLHAAAAGLYVRTGSRYETARTNGLSHFVEHMLFRGSAGFPTSFALNRAIEERCGMLCGETGRDYSLYQVQFHPREMGEVLHILGDLFASVSILLDKPFVPGDFVVVADFKGTVEHIGVKTTRVRSLGGEQIVFSNNDLLQSRLRNFKRMNERRVLFKLNVDYLTSAEQIESIPPLLRQIVEAQQGTRFDRAHFASYGDSSLLFEVVYFVLTPDYNRYMDVQQAINLEIYRRFAASGIAFAYPTHTVVLKGPATAPAEGAAPGGVLAPRP